MREAGIHVRDGSLAASAQLEKSFASAMRPDPLRRLWTVFENNGVKADCDPLQPALA